jgi:hypothetical protein
VDLSTLSVRELLALWARTLRELRDRGVVRTFNNPIGDIAEELVALHYGATRGSFSQKTWDVAVGDALLQVKALRRTGTGTRRSLSPVRSADAYTAVAVVIFTEDLCVEQALRIPREVVNELFERRPHVKAASSSSVAASWTIPPLRSSTLRREIRRPASAETGVVIAGRCHWDFRSSVKSPAPAGAPGTTGTGGPAERW